jgi:LDH2 family malate/lactate/ureidoglycolate dehydrogenase
MPVGELRVGHAELMRLVAALLQRLGSRPQQAAVIAEAIVSADARGYPSHGVALMPYYRQLVESGLDPAGEPETVDEYQAVAVVDGHNGFGHLAATHAMRVAIERAREYGIAAVAVRGSNHCGAMSVYSSLASAEHMVGIAMTNAMPTMAPWGGRERLLGINPVAISIPAHGTSFTLDVSFAVAARAKVVLRAQQGETLPEGWALDSEGAPTTDATKALAGLLKPIGDYKGTGMALAVGLLTTALSGAAFGSRLGSLEAGPVPGADGQLMIAIEVAAFVERDEFEKRVQEVLSELRESQPARGHDRVRLPGERSAQHEQLVAATGIPLAPASIEALRRLAEELSVSPSTLSTVGW